MISDAISIRLSRKERAVLEARLRAGSTVQRLLLRTRIVLEAAEGLGIREIARELDTTPTTVSLWRGRFARQRLDGLEDLPRSGAPPIYNAETDKRIRAVLDQPPPKGYARWDGPLIAKALAMSTFSTSGAPCASRKSIWVVARVGARATIRSSRSKLPMSSASTWRRLRTRLCSVSTRSPQSRRSNAHRVT